MVHLANRTRIQNCTNSFMFLAINSSKLHCSGRTTPWSRFGIKRLKTEFSTHLPRHYWAEKYIIFWEYIKFILVPLTWSIVGPTMNLISVSHYSCQRKEYVFNILSKYCIITFSGLQMKIFKIHFQLRVYRGSKLPPLQFLYVSVCISNDFFVITYRLGLILQWDLIFNYINWIGF